MKNARRTLALSFALVAALAAFPALAAGARADSAAVDVRPLGKGSVHVRFAATKQGGLLVAPTTDLASVVGMIIRVPATRTDLVAVASRRSTGGASRALAILNAQAKVGIDAASLAGAAPQIALQASLAGVHEIEVTLITQDGHQVPLSFQAENFTGHTIGRTF
jgi:hypothetical protein